LWASSAIVAGLAHPPGYLWWAVLVMPAVLIALLAQARRPFWLAWGWGVLYYTTLGLPLLYLLELQTGNLALSWLGLLLLAGLTALTTGLFGWGVVRWVLPLKGQATTAWLVPFGVASLWTLSQWLRGLGEFAFVWGHFAPALAFQPTLIQLIDTLGTWGLEFWILFWNGLLLFATLWGGRRRWVWQAVSAGLLMLWLGAGYGLLQVWSEPPSRTARVAIVQPNVDLARAYLPHEWEAVRADLATLIQQAGAQQPDLIVLPEVMEPYPMPDSARAFAWWRQQAQRAGIPILTGGYRVANPETEQWTNTVHLFLPDGTWRHHDKVQLVPLGEHVPYRQFLGFLRIFGIVERDLLAGQALKPLELGGVRIGAVICMESTYPWIARAMVREGANLLVVGSNESWFGHTPALDQHLAFSILRAVETRRWVVRSAPEGVSAFIAPSGKVQRLPSFTPAVQVRAVGTESVLTPTVRWGDWCIALYGVSVFVCGLLVRVQRKKGAGGQASSHRLSGVSPRNRS